MSLDNLIIYSLGIFIGVFGLIISVSYIAYKTKGAQIKRNLTVQKNYY